MSSNERIPISVKLDPLAAKLVEDVAHSCEISSEKALEVIVTHGLMLDKLQKEMQMKIKDPTPTKNINLKFPCDVCGVEEIGDNLFGCPTCQDFASETCCATLIPNEEGIKVGKLITSLQLFKKKYGNVPVDVITEIGSQTEQPCGGIALSPREKRIKILPVGF